MRDLELLVTRLPALRVALLQLHGASVQTAEQFAACVLGNHCERRTPTEGPRVYSIGPMEWLLIDHSIFEVRRLLRNGVARSFVRLTDVSNAFTSFSIRGTHTRTVLARDIGASLSAAEPGYYASTRLGQIEVILHCTGENTFAVHVERSLASDFESWLAVQQSGGGTGSALGH